MDKGLELVPEEVMGQEILVGNLVAFALCLLFLRILESVAQRIGLVDYPGGRKTHGDPTPVVGGVAMFFAFAISALIFGRPLPVHILFFVGASILVLVGVLDDLHDLTSRHRLGAQIAVSLLMTLGAGILLADFGHLIVPDALLSSGVLAVPLTLFATVGVINAVNMVDGIDGLAASLALVTVGSLCVIATAGGAPEALGTLLLSVPVVLAFLLFNLRPNGIARVFMGDAGSMFLGFVLAWFLIQFSQGEHRLMAPVTALWIFALPLFDTVSMMLRRMLLGRSPFLADREHLHHILTAAGFTPKQTLGAMLFLALAAAGVGLAGHFLEFPEPVMFFAFLGLFTAHFWTIMRAWRVKRFLSRPLMVLSGTSD